VIDLKVILKPDECLCVGCFQKVTKASCYTGKVHLGTSFYQQEYQEIELVFTDKGLSEEVVNKTRNIPIPTVRRGFICTSCAANYKTREVKHRDGSVSWEPVVQIDRSPTEHTTLNPGWSREDQMGDPGPVHTDRMGFVVPEELDHVAFNGYKMVFTGVSKPRNGFQQVVLREKVDRAKERLKRR
jgi:hypothetical protein